MLDVSLSYFFMLFHAGNCKRHSNDIVHSLNFSLKQRFVKIIRTNFYISALTKRVLILKVFVLDWVLSV